jgi:hypothetical protein
MMKGMIFSFGRILPILMMIIMTVILPCFGGCFFVVSVVASGFQVSVQ